MNHIGYDVMQLGELDLSLDKLDLNTLISRAQFDVLGSNIDRRGSEDIWEEYVIKRIGGLKIGIFGELRASLLRKEKAIQEDYFANAQLMVEKLRKKGCDLIICIAHVDDRNAKALPDSVAGIDIVMGGKVAGPMKKVHEVGESYYINSGDRGRFVGLMQLHLNRAKEIDSVAVTIESMETSYPEDPYIKALVDEFLPGYDKKKGKTTRRTHTAPKVKPTGTTQKPHEARPDNLSPLRSSRKPSPQQLAPARKKPPTAPTTGNRKPN